MTAEEPEGEPEPSDGDAAPLAADPRVLVDEQGVRGYLTAFVRRARTGDLGSLPVVIGVIVIWAVFQAQDSSFLTAFNLTNLVQDMVATGTISLGIVLVLLLGEVDLSAGSVSGVTSAVMIVLNVNEGWNPALAVIVSILIGAGIGAIHGLFFAKIGVPAFVVTLAGLIAWQGLQLYVLGSEGTVNLPGDGFVRRLSLNYLAPGVAWGFAVAVLVLYAAAQLLESRSRSAAGLRPRPLVEIVVRLVVVAAALFVSVIVLDRYNGVPDNVLIFLVLIVVFDLVIRRTRYGRHVLAVGGNVEAARRAGINVAAIRISVFILASSMAAVGGILAASRLGSVGQSSGGSDLLLNAIAAAVIGGTSLFGGRGSAYSALLGVLVIQSISNGINLIGLGVAQKFMITGAVTLAAVTLDAVSRRGQRATGRV